MTESLEQVIADERAAAQTLRRHRSARHPLIFPIPVSMKCAHSGSRLVAIGVADARAGNDRAVVEALIVASNRVSAGMTV